MDENINIYKILKDAPTGTKLWSIIHGTVELVKAHMESLNGDIYCKTDISHNNVYLQFDKEGHWLYETNGRKCFFSESVVLFPSRNYLGWRDFSTPWKHKYF